MKPLPWFYAPNLAARPESVVLVTDESRHLARSRRLAVKSLFLTDSGRQQKRKSWISVSGELGLRLS